MALQLIKEAIPEIVKIKLSTILSSAHNPTWEKYANIDRKRIFVFLAGFYQNLGDMAITYAHVNFLKKEFPDAVVICIPSSETYSSIRTIKRFIRGIDLITIVGGGNIDENYPSLENARLHVVKSFQNNRIISFPQTIFFSESKNGKKMVAKSRKVYQKHQHLMIFTREAASFRRGNELFPKVKNIGLVPDIVLSLQLGVEKIAKDDRIMLCLRSDKESRLDRNFQREIRLQLKTTFGDIIERDTVDVTIEECKQENCEGTLFGFWKELCSCKVVVTDRLHCMLFCVITKTPCVALDNINHKISGVYDAWLKGVPFIKIVQKQNVQSVLTEVERLKEHDYSFFKIDFNKEFEPLRKALHEQ